MGTALPRSRGDRGGARRTMRPEPRSRAERPCRLPTPVRGSLGAGRTTWTQAHRWPQVGLGRVSPGRRTCPTTAATASGGCPGLQGRGHEPPPQAVDAWRRPGHALSFPGGTRRTAAPSPRAPARTRRRRRSGRRPPRVPWSSGGAVPTRALWIGASRGPWFAARWHHHPEGAAAALRHPQPAQLVEPHAREGQDGDGGEEIGVGCAEQGNEVPVRQRVVRPHARAKRGAWAMAGLSVWKQRIWVGNSPDAHHVAAAAAA